MIPILKVDDKTYVIEGIDYLEGEPKTAIVEIDGVKQFFHDVSISMNPKALNLSDAIYFTGRYDPLIEELNKMIFDTDNEMNETALNLAELIINNKFNKSQTIRKYQELKQLKNSLQQAKDIIVELVVLGF